MFWKRLGYVKRKAIIRLKRLNGDRNPVTASGKS
jgi:hypothetical protein